MYLYVHVTNNVENNIIIDSFLLYSGGIGGVHIDGQNTLDISADLLELSRCAIMVVSAGIKSILDIGRTLEYLVSI